MLKQLTTIKAHCAASGNPFHELGFSNGSNFPIRRRLTQVEAIVDMGSAYVACGLLEDVHVFGRTFVYRRDDKVIFHCQSFQQFNYLNLDDDITAFILERKDALFQTYFEEECIFLGGC